MFDVILPPKTVKIEILFEIKMSVILQSLLSKTKVISTSAAWSVLRVGLKF